MKIGFTKMQGLGNDYVYVSCLEENMAPVRELSEKRKEALAVQMSRRHTGIGADGLIFILPSERADCRMEMYNADGSRGAMCGNGLRCVAWYAVSRGLIDREELDIETDSGIRKVWIRKRDEEKGQKGLTDAGAVTPGRQGMVRADMGSMTNLGERRLWLQGRLMPVQLVSAGNPHCVIFVENIRRFPLEEAARQIQAMPDFAEGMNVEAASVEREAVTDEIHIDMRVYERGTGETLACGTGACAVCAAAVWQGYCRYDENIEIRQPGGVLTTAYLLDGRMMMEGPAVSVFEGEWELDR